jgi:hypothetical protein
MNILDFDFLSSKQIDKVIGIYSGSFTAASRPSFPALGATNAIGISDLTYFVGTFTVDGGNPNDLGAEELVNGFSVQAVGATSNNTLDIYYNNADTATHTIAYNVAIISKPSNTLYTPANLPTNKLYFNSSANYQKIAFDATEPITVAAAVGTTPTDTVITVAHNLGYKPCVRAFTDNGTTLTDTLTRNALPLVFNYNILMTNAVDTSNAYFRFTNFDTTARNLNLNYRIYYDAN